MCVPILRTQNIVDQPANRCKTLNKSVRELKYKLKQKWAKHSLYQLYFLRFYSPIMMNESLFINNWIDLLTFSVVRLKMNWLWCYFNVVDPMKHTLTSWSCAYHSNFEKSSSAKSISPNRFAKLMNFFFPLSLPYLFHFFKQYFEVDGAKCKLTIEKCIPMN